MQFALLSGLNLDSIVQKKTAKCICPNCSFENVVAQTKCIFVQIVDEVIERPQLELTSHFPNYPITNKSILMKRKMKVIALLPAL